MKITRREFFTKTIQGAVLVIIPSTLGSFLESCNNQSTNPANPANQTYPGSQLPVINANLSNGSISLSIDSSSPLSGTGTAALVDYHSGSLLVDHPDGNTFNALSSVCTHQGCIVSTFNSASGQFVCPCHGSRYDINGQVKQGPAPAPLTKYQTQFSNNVLIIKI
jgi:cytochrome b6-f complex iron-sulfur subunit